MSKKERIACSILLWIVSLLLRETEDQFSNGIKGLAESLAVLRDD